MGVALRLPGSDIDAWSKPERGDNAQSHERRDAFKGFASGPFEGLLNQAPGFAGGT